MNACDRFIVDSHRVKKLFFCCKIVNFIKSSTTSIVIKSWKKERKKERKKNEKRNKREQESVTWLNEKGAKTLRSVEWINETAQKWTKWHKFWGKHLLIIGSEMQKVFDFSWIIAVIIVQSRLKLYEFTIFIISCGSWTEQVCNPNPFAQRHHRGPVWSNWRQNLHLNR